MLIVLERLVVRPLLLRSKEKSRSWQVAAEQRQEAVIKCLMVARKGSKEGKQIGGKKIEGCYNYRGRTILAYSFVFRGAFSVPNKIESWKGFPCLQTRTQLCYTCCKICCLECDGL